MKRPTQVIVGPHTYTITFDRDDIKKLKDAKSDEASDLIGYSQHLQQMIYIDPEVAPTIQRESLLHEITHALFFTYNLSAALDRQDDPEEVFIRDFTAPMLQLLRQNGELFRWLYDDKDE